MDKKTMTGIKKLSTNKSLQKIGKIMPVLEVQNFLTELTAAYRENLATQIEIERIKTQKECVLKEMELKYDLYNRVFSEIFSERKIAINKSFEIIDKGLQSNDKELINMGMSSLSKIVSSSPFSDLKNLSALMENDEIIEI